ncbi:MAG TPA: hypothetical protein PLM16_01140 [Candidatus Woesebacteria bacterium]|nr:hypothetical protein [Candidatus Woesebacteria bacterium]
MSKNKIESSTENLLNFPTLLVLIIMLLLGFGQLQRLQLTNQVAIYGHDFFIGIFVFWTTLVTSHKIEFLKNSFHRWRYLLWFISWTVLSLILNQIKSGVTLIPWLYNFRFWLYLGFGLMLNQQLIAKKISFSVVRAGTFMMFGFIIFIGIFQYLFIPDLRFLGEGGWDVHYYRMAGNMLDPNFYGMILTLGFLFLFFASKKCQSRLWIGLLYAFCLALTYSRSSYLVFVGVLTYLLYQTHQLSWQSAKKPLLFTLVSFCLILLVLPRPGGLGVQLSRTETIVSRIETNQSVLSEFNWWTLMVGQGFFTPAINQHQSSIVHAHFPDNILVFLLSASGLPGLYLIGRFAYLELKKATKDQALTKIAILGGLFIHAQFNLTFFEPIVLLITLICFTQTKATSPASLKGKS